MHRQVLIGAAFGLAAVAHAEATPPAEVTRPAYVVRAIGGARGVDFSIEARGGFHLNDDYPSRVDASADDTVRVVQPRVERFEGKLTPCPGGGHACKLVLPVAARGATGGRVAGTVAFSVCDAERCLIEKVRVGAPLR